MREGGERIGGPQEHSALTISNPAKTTTTRTLAEREQPRTLEGWKHTAHTCTRPFLRESRPFATASVSIPPDRTYPGINDLAGWGFCS